MTRRTARACWSGENLSDVTWLHPHGTEPPRNPGRFRCPAWMVAWAGPMRVLQAERVTPTPTCATLAALGMTVVGRAVVASNQAPGLAEGPGRAHCQPQLRRFGPKWDGPVQRSWIDGHSVRSLTWTRRQPQPSNRWNSTDSPMRGGELP